MKGMCTHFFIEIYPKTQTKSKEILNLVDFICIGVCVVMQMFVINTKQFINVFKLLRIKVLIVGRGRYKYIIEEGEEKPHDITMTL
jgi:hypothetical protein